MERERGGVEKAWVKGSSAAPRSILRHCDTAAPRTSISLKAFKEAERARSSFALAARSQRRLINAPTR